MDSLATHGQQSIKAGSSSFQSAARLFAPSMREDAWLLYAWCRRCDDEIDGQQSGFTAQQAPDAPTPAERLQSLRDLTRAALDGAPMIDPDFAAFQRVASRHRFDPRWPMTLLDGFGMDVERRTYRTLEELLDYCFGVAGVVGVMMGRIMGVREIDVLRRAQDLGLAFQLTNIVRDIYEDARAGRLYLPADSLRQLGVEASVEAVLDPRNAAAVHRVAQHLLEVADAYYNSARVGLRDLPMRAALAIGAARDVYRGIGRVVEKGGPRALCSRASCGRAARYALVLRGCAVGAWSRGEKGLVVPVRGTLWSKI